VVTVVTKDRISQLMDGELDEGSAAEVIGQLSRDGEAAEAWRSYHLIGDALRGTAPLSEGFAARVSWKLADEPTVLAPGRAGQQRPEPRRWFTASALAASLAAVALVGWMAFAPQNPMVPAPTLVQAPVAPKQVEAKPNIVPLPTAANDYLLAHQGFSPRVSLQGMAPYVRTVSEQVVEPRR
jgi:sigma-E factor negative regulatory protein RseA